MGQGSVILATFALVASFLVALTYEGTKDTIAENEKQSLLRSLHVLVPPSRHDNDLYLDQITLETAELSFRKKPITVFRARMDNQPVAVILSIIAPDGYGGPIKMLVAINEDGSLSGVRVVTHKETPGLGDAIEAEKSDWIQSFNDKSLGDPPERDWLVRKDGGEFDQFTGATITPRALVKAVFKSLKFYSRNKKMLFTVTSDPIKTRNSN